MNLPRSLVLIAIPLLLGACSSGTMAQPQGGSGASGPRAASGTITVFAASSLQEAFTTLGHQFERGHPGSTVTFDFDASSTLAEQITQGAPADVFASASPTNMEQVAKTGDAGSPANFVSNVMEVAVPPDNPAGIRRISDLAKAGVKVALCAPEVPCGAVAHEVFNNAGIRVNATTLEPDVKSTLTKVELGEVDAGMVYVTDVRAAGSKVKGVRIPDNVNASTDYPIAALPTGPNPEGGKAFVRYVLSPAGARVLSADGFRKP